VVRRERFGALAINIPRSPGAKELQATSSRWGERFGGAYIILPLPHTFWGLLPGYMFFWVELFPN